MPSLLTLESRRQRLTQQVLDHLDFLIGSISSKGFKYPAYNLTAKIEGKTKTRHIPKDMLPLVRRLTSRYRKLKSLLRQLDEVNWQLLLHRGRLQD
jgi:hypothetical protein